MRQSVKVRRTGAIVSLVLDSGQKLNALNRETWVQLSDAVDCVAADETVRCVVLAARPSPPAPTSPSSKPCAPMRNPPRLTAIW